LVALGGRPIASTSCKGIGTFLAGLGTSVELRFRIDVGVRDESFGGISKQICNAPLT
jgi:hypothetical protein